MIESPLSLKDFFPLDVKENTRLRDISLNKINIKLKRVDEKEADAFQSEIGTAYKNCMDINAVDIFVSGWCKAKEIIKYGNTKKFPPGKIYDVALSRHRIVTEHEPVIEVRSLNKVVAEFKLTISLALEFEVAVLKINGGYIKGISSGNYKATGAVEFGKLTLSKISNSPYAFKGELKFKDPGYKIPQSRGWFFK